jgi:hypothetical protein
MGLKLESLSFNLPFGLGGANIVVTEAQRNVAWALYVELATRISSVPLAPGQGSIREALNSLHSLFDTTRSVLREQGPGAAQGAESVGPLAIEILNRGLRPFLVDWHTRLSGFEDAQAQEQREKYGGNTQVIVDESQWPDHDAFYAALEDLRQQMVAYIAILARIAEVSRD